jgi:hypothetical protein
MRRVRPYSCRTRCRWEAQQEKRTRRRAKAGGYRYGTLAETGAFTSNRLDSPPFTAKRFRSISHTRTPAAPGAAASSGPEQVARDEIDTLLFVNLLDPAPRTRK